MTTTAMMMIMMMSIGTTIVPPPPPPVVAMLWNMIESDDAKALKQWLDKGNSLDSLDFYPGEPPLALAARAGAIKVTRLLLSLGEDPKIGNALIWAVNKRHNDIAELLLQRGAPPDVMDWGGYSPLQRAIDSSDTRLFDLLLKYHADPNFAARSDPPIFHALKVRSSNFTTKLIGHGANVESRDEKGWTPLAFACYYGLDDLALILLDHSADPNQASLGRGRGTPFHAACGWASLKLVKEMLDRGADVHAPDKEGFTPIFYAVCDLNHPPIFATAADTTEFIPFTESRREVIELLLRRGADMTRKTNNGSSLMTYAIKQIRYGAVECLLANGYNTNEHNEQGESLLIQHLRRPNRTVRMARILLNAGVPLEEADPKPDWDEGPKRGRVDSALLAACRRNNGPEADPALIDLLIERGSDVNYNNTKTGECPLDVAVHENEPEIVEQLYQANAWRASGYYKIELMDYSTAYGFPDCIRVLAKYGMDVNSIYLHGAQGELPVHRAVQRASPSVLKALLDCGANPNAIDSEWNTPLHYAVMKTDCDELRPEMVGLLIAKGANRDIRNKAGKTALDLAREGGSTEVVEALGR